ncbi:HesA/MoeB/ThiF family protein [Bordetella genomosp. 1]|nr:ThiF family adenylyltransferase [Bordetella genomosp. 1]
MLMPKKFVAAGDVFIGFSGDQCIVGLGGRQTVFPTLKDCEPILQAISFWKKPQHIAAVLQHLAQQGHSESSALKAINFLVEKHHVVYYDDAESASLERYNRHLLYYGGWSYDPADVQQNLAQSHVVILGCGGIGNHLAVNLATAGIGHLTLVDDDVIELSNLTRQHMFCESDLGEPKVDVLARELEKRNSEVSVDRIALAISGTESLELLPRADVIALSADTPESIAIWVNDYAIRGKFPYLVIGYVGDIAVFGPFYIPNRTGCYCCNANLTQDLSLTDTLSKAYCGSINQNSKPPSFVAVNAIAAAMATNDILRYLGGYAEPLSANKRIGIHTRSLQIEVQDCNKSGSCQACAQT